MKPEKQRIAIAEACGKRIELWTEPSGTQYWVILGPDGKVVADAAPDYLNDLNAIHRAVLSLLTMEQLVEWAGWLYMNARGNHADKDVALVIASAAQRAEAFLRTIGKWEDE